jgi:hypothetical protein
MVGKVKTLIVLAVATPALCGCQSFLGGAFAAKSPRATSQEKVWEAFAEAELESGRRALDDGRLADAVASFRIAGALPKQAAGASNGLAVAYARLGRADLAERYFRQAIALAPQDARYQANLDRFYRRSPIALPTAVTATASMEVEARAPAVAVAPASAPATIGVPSAVTVLRPSTRLVRVSANEVRLAAPAESAIRTASSGVGQPATKRGAPRTVRISFATRDGQAPSRRVNYPVRVELGASR